MIAENEKPVSKVCLKCMAIAVAMIPILVMIYFLLTGDAE